MFNNYNPYFGNQQRVAQPLPQYDMQQPIQPMQYQQPMYQQPKVNNIQGKAVDSIEVVKATDIPMDGSVSYFPISDGSAIVTKQLQNDGTSKITIYKPFEENTEEVKEIKYLTKDDLKGVLEEFGINTLQDIQEEIKSLRDEINGKKESKGK